MEGQIPEVVSLEDDDENEEMIVNDSGQDIIILGVTKDTIDTLIIQHEDPILDVIALIAEKIHDYQKQDPVFKQLYSAIKHNRLWDWSLKQFTRFRKYIFIKDKILCKINKYHENTYIVPFPVFADLPGHAHFQPYNIHQTVGLKIHLPGDLVTNKFKPRYHGPYKIIQVTYTIESEEGKQFKSITRTIERWILPPHTWENNPLVQRLDYDLEDLEPEPIGFIR
ncbi:hypothetical protein Avbf_17655 [Armadillidium vulgare]|nr:hypothetical protein Avbf_17655 [Armadillidium vulgare]